MLVCDKQYQSDFVGSVSFIGRLLGFLYTCFADLSKPLASPLIFTSIACALTAFAGYLSSTIYSYWIIMFIYHYLTSVVQTFSFSHTVEAMKHNPRLKEICVQLIYFGWGLSSVYIGLLDLISPDWRLAMGLYVGVPTLLICIYYYNLGDRYKQYLEDEKEKRALYMSSQTERSGIEIGG